jgi:NitT/TauT family transport system ATP-binding protein
MTNNPGTIKEVINITLPRPRSDAIKSSPQFSILRHRIWELLHNKVTEEKRETDESISKKLDYSDLSDEVIQSMASGI